MRRVRRGRELAFFRFLRRIFSLERVMSENVNGVDGDAVHGELLLHGNL